MSDPASLAAALGHDFRELQLLETALTHPSFAHEHDGSRGNERLEFLGDAVLDLVVARLLFDAHPDWAEGELTRARAALVNRRSLATCARRLELGRFVRLGRTERRSEGQGKESVLANCFEAVVGALYLDGGLVPVDAFCTRIFGERLATGSRVAARDAKTQLQEWSHARTGHTPRYRTVADSSVEDDEARFTVEVRMGDQVVGQGVGRSKRSAERRAAEAALANRTPEDG